MRTCVGDIRDISFTHSAASRMISDAHPRQSDASNPAFPCP